MPGKTREQLDQDHLNAQNSLVIRLPLFKYCTEEQVLAVFRAIVTIRWSEYGCRFSHRVLADALCRITLLKLYPAEQQGNNINRIVAEILKNDYSTEVKAHAICMLSSLEVSEKKGYSKIAKCTASQRTTPQLDRKQSSSDKKVSFFKDTSDGASNVTGTLYTAPTNQS